MLEHLDDAGAIDGGVIADEHQDHRQVTLT